MFAKDERRIPLTFGNGMRERRKNVGTGAPFLCNWGDSGAPRGMRLRAEWESMSNMGNRFCAVI